MIAKVLIGLGAGFATAYFTGNHAIIVLAVGVAVGLAHKLIRYVS